jgi:hypothetical protein
MSKMSRHVFSLIEDGTLPMELDVYEYQDRKEYPSTPAVTDSTTTLSRHGHRRQLQSADIVERSEGRVQLAPEGKSFPERLPYDAI